MKKSCLWGMIFACFFFSASVCEAGWFDRPAKKKSTSSEKRQSVKGSSQPESQISKDETDSVKAVKMSAKPEYEVSETLSQWRKTRIEAVQAQISYVKMLEKKLDGEKRQLNELAAEFGRQAELDVEKLKNGRYRFDEKKREIVES